MGSVYDPPAMGINASASVRRLLREALEEGWPEEQLVEELRNVIPLDERRRNAVTNYRRGLKERGVPLNKRRALTKKYARDQYESRARTIARTEAQKLRSMIRLEGWRAEYGYNVSRRWVAGPGACAICQALHGTERVLWSDYNGFVKHPPAHPNCNCREELIDPYTGRIMKSEPRDGDGDGFVYDGTPRMRPAAVGVRKPSASRSKAIAALVARRMKTRGELSSKPDSSKEEPEKPKPKPAPTKPHADHEVPYEIGVPGKPKFAENTGKMHERKLRKAYRAMSGNPDEGMDSFTHLGLAEGISEEYTEDEFVAAVVEMIRGRLTGDLVTRVPRHILPALKEDGRLRNQHEEHVGTSSGYWDPGARSEAEFMGMGVPEDMDATKRPVYGSIENDESLRADTYGDVTLYIDPAITDRITVSAGDSLNSRSYPIRLDRLAEASPTEILAATGDGYLYSLILEIRDMLNETEYVDMRENDEYNEIQIHGGLNMSNIVAVAPAPGLEIEELSEFAEAIGAELREE